MQINHDDGLAFYKNITLTQAQQKAISLIISTYGILENINLIYTKSSNLIATMF